jgi:hypothetical protein
MRLHHGDDLAVGGFRAAQHCRDLDRMMAVIIDDDAVPFTCR